MSLTENWPAKLAIIVVIAFIAGGAYYAVKAGEHMKLKQQMDVVLYEKYKNPTEDGRKKAYAELGIEWSRDRELTTEEMKRFIAGWEAEKQKKLGGR
jgi:hypothetical protein